eukprot:TRINITY_DN3287_c0_g2_i1.p3 TRINITY_DN3287_c0_g2~~TRINITY_DN3287_c0_g2_i1.p3  ORF type:complete len:145 (-),score=40.04 TRINITY_DN3287_c0_g2_i1:25-459(-)
MASLATVASRGCNEALVTTIGSDGPAAAFVDGLLHSAVHWPESDEERQTLVTWLKEFSVQRIADCALNGPAKCAEPVIIHQYARHDRILPQPSSLKLYRALHSFSPHKTHRHALIGGHGTGLMLYKTRHVAAIKEALSLARSRL